MVDLVKYYVVFPVLLAFMKWGRKGYFQTQRSKTVMTAVLTVRSGLDPHMIRDGWMDGYACILHIFPHLRSTTCTHACYFLYNHDMLLRDWRLPALEMVVKTKLVEPPVDCLWRYGVFR
ncbi:hypothetical protein EJB05_08872, partial [Eragrostis curvula]